MVIERAQISRVIEEQELEWTGAVRTDQAVQLGQLLGVQYMLVGSVGRFSIDTKRVGFGGIGAEYTEAESAITIRVISTETGEIVAAVEAEGKKRLVGLSSDQADFSSSSDFNLGLAQQALSPAIDGMVEELGKREDVLVSFDMAVPASIVGEGRNGAIYLDKGENFGIAVGARFEVLRVVDEIVDASGTVLDRITERVGVLEVEQVLSQSSIAKITEGEAQEGDMLRPISSSD